MKPMCVHCRQRPATRPRAMCSTCYFGTPEARDLYPVIGSGGRRGVKAPTGPLPLAPTACTPGTEAKLLVLIARAERGELLWHPDDARADADGDLAARNTRPRPTAGERDTRLRAGDLFRPAPLGA